MKNKILLIILLTCSCILQGQVWNNIIDSLPRANNYYFKNTLVDTINDILYISGSFDQVNQQNTRCIIKYNGTTFDTLGGAIDNQWRGLNTPTDIRSMAMFQNKLYVGGQFHKAGDYYTPNLARWNGTNWDTVNFKPNSIIEGMETYDNELYVCGSFDTIGGIKANNIAKFDGTNWHSLNFPFNDLITDIAIFQDTLYATGNFYQGGFSLLAKYNGTTWVPWRGVTGTVYKTVFSLKVIDSMLYVLGRFDDIASTNCRGLAAYNGKKWYGYGTGVSNITGERIRDIQKINGELYIVGLFDKIQNTGNSNTSTSQFTNLAKFDGQKWCIVSPPFDNDVSGVVWYKNNLYCHGGFRKVGNDSVFGLLKWNGGNTTISCSSPVSIYQSPESVNELSVYDNIKLYPNPATEILNISDEDKLLQNSIISITNSLGQIITTSTFTDEINIKNIESGVYIISFLNSNGTVIRFKFIKQN